MAVDHTRPPAAPDAVARTACRISVVIPTYNRAELLRLSLAALARQSMPTSEFEVIVADDGSSDDTGAVVESFRDRLRLSYVFQPDEGFRAAEARNKGAALASAPIIAFLDTGVIPGSDWLSGHLHAHETAPGPPRLVAGYLYGNNHADSPLALDDVRQYSAEELVSRFAASPSFTDVRQPEIDALNGDLDREGLAWYFCWSANVSLPTTAFRAVGGFNEAYRGWGIEDLDFAYRLQQRGCPTHLATEAWAVEAPHERAWERNFDSCRRNALRFVTTNPQPRTELFWAVIEDWPDATFHEEWLLVREALARTRDEDLSGELEALTRTLPPGRPRVAVLGSGAVLPTSWARSRARFTLVDADPTALEAAVAGDGRPPHCDTVHAIGLRTPLPDASFDVVVVTSRLSGVRQRWDRYVLAEARRLGTHVREADAGSVQLSEASRSKIVSTLLR